MPELIEYDANQTDGTDLSKMFAVYRIAGRRVRVPADYTPAQIKQFVMQHYGIEASHYDQLDQLNNALSQLDYTTITGLTDNSTTPELVDAIQTLAQALRHTVAMLRFMLKNTDLTERL